MNIPVLTLVFGFSALSSSCSPDDTRSAAQVLGNVSAAAGEAINPAVKAASEGFVDAAIQPSLDAMLECSRRRAAPQRITENVEVKGRPVKECLTENGGVINEAVIRCRNGYSSSQTREVPYLPNPAIKCQ